jgi:hypothetical protein
MRNFIVVAGAAVLLAGFSSFALATEPNRTVEHFIATCSKYGYMPARSYTRPYVRCMSTMMVAELTPGYCAPPELTQPDTVRSAAIEWLKQHPEMSSMTDTAGIFVALKALYCH